MNKNKFYNLIEKSKKNKTLIAVYRSEDLSVFSVGYVVAFRDGEFILFSISDKGNFDGLSSVKISSIVKMEYETRYLQKIQFMYYQKSASCEEGLIQTIDSTDAIFQNAFQRGVMIGVWIVGDDISVNGFIREIDDIYVKIEMINSDGESDGFIVFERAKVDSVQIDGEDQRSFTLVFENHREIFRS